MRFVPNAQLDPSQVEDRRSPNDPSRFRGVVPHAHAKGAMVVGAAAGAMGSRRRQALIAQIAAQVMRSRPR